MAPNASSSAGMPAAYPEFRDIHRYRDHRLGLVAKILPGEFYVTEQEEWIITVLGSCVSACIRDPHTGVGGMNHFMLPVDRNTTGEVCISGANRYGNFAMENLINTILKHGGRRAALEVKVVGGGNILAHMTDIGKNNIEFVRSYLATEGFDAIGEDLGGTQPRRVHYDPHSGAVRVKKLRDQSRDTAVREQRFMETFEAKPVAGDIELF